MSQLMPLLQATLFLLHRIVQKRVSKLNYNSQTHRRKLVHRWFSLLQRVLVYECITQCMAAPSIDSSDQGGLCPQHSQNCSLENIPLRGVTWDTKLTLPLPCVKQNRPLLPAPPSVTH
ncbi:hypothetical protein XELAEV_18037926mg [Xenopus laevis]|uniref:Uncharacterized protein n=1 Tax=Xenopus laevis TaxID=8355 RepID=A0A974CD57_XENLA|nr:hypothetical protein XELAEV_18037926mg [Xenopus laevis]